MALQLSNQQVGWVKTAVFVLSLLPFARLVWGTATGAFTDPLAEITGISGEWALYFLCITLAVTPLRTVLGWPELARFRRLLGLLTFGYAALHLLCYAVFDMGLDGGDIARDIAKRPFILVGFSAFVLLLALAATSFNRAIRWLGAARWQALHRTVYAVAVLAVLHFWWMRSGKRLYGEVWIYALILAALLGWRVLRRLKQRPA